MGSAHCFLAASLRRERATGLPKRFFAASLIRARTSGSPMRSLMAATLRVRAPSSSHWRFVAALRAEAGGLRLAVLQDGTRLSIVSSKASVPSPFGSFGAYIRGSSPSRCWSSSEISPMRHRRSEGAESFLRPANARGLPGLS
jgi:hypothetical protein